MKTDTNRTHHSAFCNSSGSWGEAAELSAAAAGAPSSPEPRAVPTPPGATGQDHLVPHTKYPKVPPHVKMRCLLAEAARQEVANRQRAFAAQIEIAKQMVQCHEEAAAARRGSVIEWSSSSRNSIVDVLDDALEGESRRAAALHEARRSLEALLDAQRCEERDVLLSYSALMRECDVTLTRIAEEAAKLPPNSIDVEAEFHLFASHIVSRHATLFAWRHGILLDPEGPMRAACAEAITLGWVAYSRAGGNGSAAWASSTPQSSHSSSNGGGESYGRAAEAKGSVPLYPIDPDAPLLMMSFAVSPIVSQCRLQGLEATKHTLCHAANVALAATSQRTAPSSNATHHHPLSLINNRQQKYSPTDLRHSTSVSISRHPPQRPPSFTVRVVSDRNGLLSAKRPNSRRDSSFTRNSGKGSSGYPPTPPPQGAPPPPPTPLRCPSGPLPPSDPPVAAPHRRRHRPSHHSASDDAPPFLARRAEAEPLSPLGSPPPLMLPPPSPTMLAKTGRDEPQEDEGVCVTNGDGVNAAAVMGLAHGEGGERCSATAMPAPIAVVTAPLISSPPPTTPPVGTIAAPAPAVGVATSFLMLPPAYSSTAATANTSTRVPEDSSSPTAILEPQAPAKTRSRSPVTLSDEEEDEERGAATSPKCARTPSDDDHLADVASRQCLLPHPLHDDSQRPLRSPCSESASEDGDDGSFVTHHRAATKTKTNALHSSTSSPSTRSHNRSSGPDDLDASSNASAQSTSDSPLLLLTPPRQLPRSESEKKGEGAHQNQTREFASDGTIFSIKNSNDASAGTVHSHHIDPTTAVEAVASAFSAVTAAAEVMWVHRPAVVTKKVDDENEDDANENTDYGNTMRMHSATECTSTTTNAFVCVSLPHPLFGVVSSDSAATLSGSSVSLSSSSFQIVSNSGSNADAPPDSPHMPCHLLSSPPPPLPPRGRTAGVVEGALSSRNCAADEGEADDGEGEGPSAVLPFRCCAPVMGGVGCRSGGGSPSLALWHPDRRAVEGAVFGAAPDSPWSVSKVPPAVAPCELELLPPRSSQDDNDSNCNTSHQPSHGQPTEAHRQPLIVGKQHGPPTASGRSRGESFSGTTGGRLAPGGSSTTSARNRSLGGTNNKISNNTDVSKCGSVFSITATTSICSISALNVAGANASTTSSIGYSEPHLPAVPPPPRMKTVATESFIEEPPQHLTD